jgi:hypothetical protein
MLSRALIALACSGLLCCGSRGTAPATSEISAATWIADPAAPGPDEPPVGRSLFDDVLAPANDASGTRAVTVPFPFEKLTALIASRLGPAEDPPLAQVLIPIGRSLQRDANVPDFFASPRVVAAVHRDTGASGEGVLFLKDRLFLGYQARAAIIEIISYNDEAGRFEFQIVRDYREGVTPRVEYAERRVCLTCHQGHGPIFPQPLWDETNANQAIRTALREHASQFFGVPVDQGIDTPQFIDDATGRANLFSAYQLFWREGCGDSGECRASALVSMLQYRLSGLHHAVGAASQDANRFAEALSKHWARAWPGGLKVANPGIPNRTPLETFRRAGERSGVAAALNTGTAEFAKQVQSTLTNPIFEPRTPRAPLEIWTAADADHEFYQKTIAGLASFFSIADIRTIDDALYASRDQSESTEYLAACEARVVAESAGRILLLNCQGERMALTLWSAWPLRPGSIQVERLAIDDAAPLTNLRAAIVSRRVLGDRESFRLQAKEQSAGLHARLASGNLIGDIEISWVIPGAQVGESFAGQAKLTVFQDLARLRAAAAEMAAAGSDALSPKPLRRVALVAEILQAL